MKNYFLHDVNRFIHNKKGAVTIEFIFMMILLTFIFAFLTDLVIVRTTQGKLDNASYSLVSILRERTELYGDRDNGEKDLTDGTQNGDVVLTNSDDLNQFQQLANLLLAGDRNAKKIEVVLERWSQNSYQALSNSTRCKPYQSLDKLKDLSPRSEINNERKIPLYQVTLCTEVGSLFQSLIVNKENQSFGLLSSSSFSVARSR